MIYPPPSNSTYTIEINQEQLELIQDVLAEHNHLHKKTFDAESVVMLDCLSMDNLITSDKGIMGLCY